MNFLGIDVGTGGSRAVLIDANGALLASATVAHRAFASPEIGFKIFKELNILLETIKLGGARSPLWRQIQADVYGQAVETITAEEGAAYGAALLAGVGAGAWKTVDEACEKNIHVAERRDPNAAAVEILNRRYKTYQTIYPSLRAIFQ